MILPDRWSLRLRILGVLGLLVVLNALFVTALVWAYGTVIPGVVAGAVMLLIGGTASVEFWTLIVSPPVLAGLIAAFLAAQAWYGYKHVLDGVWSGTADAEEYPDLHAAVTRLSAMADVSPPSIAVVDGESPNCFTVGRAGDATIVVTRPLLELLDGEELEAVLAHEIAHVKHRDVTLMTIASLFIAVAERAYRSSRLLRRAADRERLSARAQLALDWLLPVVIVSYVFVAPILWLFPPIARIANETLAQVREFAADEAAAAITGRPLALAGALTTLYESEGEAERPSEDLRRSTDGLRALCIVPFGTTWGPTDVSGSSGPFAPDSNGGGDAGTASAEPEADAPSDGESGVDADELERWLAERSPADDPIGGTHPPVEERVERLVALATDGIEG